MDTAVLYEVYTCSSPVCWRSGVARDGLSERDRIFDGREGRAPKLLKTVPFPMIRSPDEIFPYCRMSIVKLYRVYCIASVTVHVPVLYWYYTLHQRPMDHVFTLRAGGT